MPNRRGGRLQAVANPVTAVIAAVLGLGFAVLVALVPRLNSNAFIQGVTGIVLVTAVAVILFSAVPSSAWVRGPVALGGAAAFFYLALTPLEHYVFPKRTLTGTIYYVGSTTPVKGVAIRDPETKQEVLTDERGDFILPNVTWSVQTLVANSGGQDYQFALNDTKTYAVIPRLPAAVKTPEQAIGGTEWQVNSGRNCPPTEGCLPNAVLLTLQKAIAGRPDYDKVYVRIGTPTNVSICHAEKLQPPRGTGGEIFDSQVQDPTSTSHVRKWWLPSSAGSINLQLAVCVNEGPASQAASDLISSAFWFEKQEGSR